jgi:regulator of protease activity HflC (stomatin/prohibitin superfamily)
MKSIKAMILSVALLTTGACTNPETPQGFEGYVYYVPLIFGQMEYRDTMRGAATTGISWRLFVENVDMQARSYPEKFQLLTVDNLSVSFEVDTRVKLRDNSVKEIVEEWGGENWYDWNVKEQLRTIVREVVTEFKATEIQLNTPKVRVRIREQLDAKFNDTPIDILSVDIGEIQFPPQVTDAIELKIGKKEELKRQDFVLDKTRKEAAIHVLGALKKAKEQQIIGSTLDPLYVQQKAVSVYKKLAASKNKTIIMLPNTNTGTGMPLVLSEGKRKILSESDRKLLADMEDKYMKIASDSSAIIDALETPTPAPDDAAEDTPEDAGDTPEGDTPPADAPAPEPAKPDAPANP